MVLSIPLSMFSSGPPCVSCDSCTFVLSFFFMNLLSLLLTTPKVSANHTLWQGFQCHSRQLCAVQRITSFYFASNPYKFHLMTLSFLHLKKLNSQDTATFPTPPIILKLLIFFLQHLLQTEGSSII